MSDEIMRTARNNYAPRRCSRTLLSTWSASFRVLNHQWNRLVLYMLIETMLTAGTNTDETVEEQVRGHQGVRMVGIDP